MEAVGRDGLIKDHFGDLRMGDLFLIDDHRDTKQDAALVVDEE
jgi:hypothetical protein